MPYIEENVDGVFELTVNVFPSDGSNFVTRLNALEDRPVLPDPTTGTDGQVLTTDGSAALWADAAAGGATFVFSSAGTQGGNRYNDWTDLLAALAALDGPKVVQFEQNETLPGEAIDLNNTTLRGKGIASTDWLTLTFPDNCTVTGWGVPAAELGLVLKSTSTTGSPVTLSDPTTFFCRDEVSITTLAGCDSFITCNEGVGESPIIAFRDGSGFVPPSVVGIVGDAGYESLNATGAGTVVVADLCGTAITRDNTIRGAGTVLRVRYSAVKAPSFAVTQGESHANASAFSVMRQVNSELVAVDPSMFAAPLTSGATNVQAALNDLSGHEHAAERVLLNFVPEDNLLGFTQLREAMMWLDTATLGGSGAVATDTIWDAAGDLAVGTGANTAAKLTKGTQGYPLVAGASTVAYEQLGTTGIADDAVTLAKINNIADQRILGNVSGSSASPSELTAAQVRTMISVAEMTYKTADESVTSSTTVQDDDHLTFPIGANETWYCEFNLSASGGSTGDLKVTVTMPSGATSELLVTAVATGGTSAQNSLGVITSSASSEIGCGLQAGTGNRNSVTIEGCVFNGANAGNVTLQWAQNTSDGTATTIRKGSTLLYRRLA